MVAPDRALAGSRRHVPAILENVSPHVSSRDARFARVPPSTAGAGPAVLPPSIAIAWPVMTAQSGLTRKCTSAASSSGAPSRPSGCSSAAVRVSRSPTSPWRFIRCRGQPSRCPPSAHRCEGRSRHPGMLRAISDEVATNADPGVYHPRSDPRMAARALLSETARRLALRPLLARAGSDTLRALRCRHCASLGTAPSHLRCAETGQQPVVPRRCGRRRSGSARHRPPSISSGPAVPPGAGRRP